jgi:hypothetical protein
VSSEPIGFGRLRHCFEGAVPVVIATVSSDGTPNVTFLSKAHLVDDQRIALSNQFLSKSATSGPSGEAGSSSSCARTSTPSRR